MTIVGSVELPVVPVAGAFTAELIKLTTSGAGKAGAAAGVEFTKQFSVTLAKSGFGQIFDGLDVQAAKSGIASGKSFSSAFAEAVSVGTGTVGQLSLFDAAEAGGAGATAGKSFASGFDEAIRVNGQSAAVLGGDAKTVSASAAAGTTSGRAYSRAQKAAVEESNVSQTITNSFRAAEVGSAGSGRRAALGFVSNFKSGLLPLAAIIAAAFAVKADTTLSADLTRIQTQAGATAQQVAEVRKETLALAPTVGIGPDKLADGFYHLYSAGFQGAQALDIETAAAKEARIGNADLGTTVQALIGLEAAHIKGITSAGQAVTVLNTIVGNGDLKLQDLAKSLGTGAVAASAIFGLSIQDLGGALDTLTDNTVKPQEAMTRLRMTIALIGAPSGAAVKSLGEIGLGATTLGDDLRKPQGIVTALTDLENHLKSSGESATQQAATLAHIFGGGRSSGAVDILINEMDRLKTKTDALYAATASGSKVFDASWATTEATTKQKLASLGAGFQVLAIDVGHDLQGPVNGFLNLLHDGFAQAPRLLAPLGSALEGTGHDVGNLLHDLQPIGGVLEAAFGGAVYGTVQAAAFLLRDVVNPAIRGVDDVISFLGDHKAVLAAVGTVVGTVLVPAIATMTAELLLDAAAWSALALAGLVADVKNLAGAVIAFAAANPLLLGAAVVLGGLAAAITLADQDTRTFTVDMQGLNSAIGDLVKTGSDSSLANTILDDLSKWKPTSGSTDAITFLHKYGVEASTVASDLADPNNAKGAQTFLSTLNDLGNSLDPQKIVNSTLLWQNLKGQLTSTNPAIRDMAKLFLNLRNDPTVSGTTITDLAKHFLTLESTIVGTTAATAAHNKAVQQLNRDLNPTTLRNQAEATKALGDAQQLLAADDKAIADGQKNYTTAITNYGTVIENQFPIFEQYRTQLNLNAQALIDNVQSEVTAIEQEQGNINTLVAAGASPQVIAALYAKGPEYVSAAAHGTKAQLDALSGIVKTRGNDISNLAFSAGVASGDANITGYVAALEQKAADLKLKQQLVFTHSFDDIAGELHTAAGDVGRNVPDNVAQGILAGRLHVINALSSGLTKPQQDTVRQLETLAAAGGAGLASQLADSIANHTPLVVTQAEALKLKTNAQVQAILKEWDITVKVDDQATAQIQALQGTITGLNNTAVKAGLGISGFDLSKLGGLAAGGPVNGNGPKGVDSQIRMLAVGEHVFTDEDVDAMGGHGNVMAFRRSLHGMAAGGPVLKGVNALDILNADAQVSKVVQASSIVQAIASGASTGGASVQAWAPDVVQVLGLLGLPLRLLPRVLAQINTESGGNASAINLTDSNAAKGDPSMGVLQTIIETFRAWAGPFIGLGPFNGFADIYAGVNYAAHRYAGDPNIGLGYGHGYDIGGALLPGATLAVNKTGAVEPILTAAQWASIGKLVAAISALTPASIEKLVTSGVTAAGAQISAAVKEGNGPLQQTLEAQLKTAEGKLYVTGLTSAANPTLGNKEAVSTAANNVATLTAQLTKLNTVNAGLVTSLNSFVSAQQQYQQTLSGAITQGNAFSDVLTVSGSPADVQSVLSGKLADVKTFAANITALKRKGFSNAIIREVAADGITNGNLYATELLSSTAAQVSSIDTDFGALGAAQTNTANSITQLTEGTIPGISKASAGVYIQQAIFTTGADVSALVGKAEFTQRTFDSGGYLYPGQKVLANNESGGRERVLTPSETSAYESGRGGVTIEKVEQHYNGVDLATAHAQSNRDLALALTAARVGG